MSPIRILLVEVAGMLNEIVRAAVACEADMTIVGSMKSGERNLGEWTRRHRVDVVVYHATAEFDDGQIAAVLHANPRLGLLAIDGPGDGAALHRLAPVNEAIGPLAQSSLASAIRAGAALRKR